MAESAIAKMFRTLRKQGFIAKRHYFCCQTCAWYDIATEKGNDFNGDVAFMHQQDEDSWRERGVAHVAWQGNGQAIVDAGRNAGLEVEWDGSENTRIQIKNPNFVDNRRRMW